MNYHIIKVLLYLAILSLPYYAQDNQPKKEEKNESIKFRHPSIMIDDQQIKSIRSAIKRGAEPQSTMYKELIKTAQEYLQHQPQPLKKVAFPPYYQNKEKHLEMRKNFDHDNDAVYTLALAYQMTQDKTYADKSLQYLKAWVRDCEGVDQNDSLGASYILVLMVYGADLLWNYNSFSKDDKEAFLKWAKGTIDDMGKLASQRANNWGAWGIQAMTAYAIISDNEEAFYKAIDEWKKHIENNMDENGLFRHEVTRYNGVDGQGILYSQFTLQGYVLTALMCQNYKVDLFNWETSAGLTIKDGATKIFSYEASPDSFPYNKKLKQLTGNFYSGWEILYNQYKVKEWAQKLAELRAEPLKYPYRANQAGAWIPLTHGVSIK
ncbi:MAG: hypothetical protein A2W23_06670 [Planctomycetes bacterium RBG_16_43_13]|nr:MAG: hypothetical protein A2W23_06670 [Planctomycetes bacterium RBG_16_43_13]